MLKVPSKLGTYEGSIKSGGNKEGVKQGEGQGKRGRWERYEGRETCSRKRRREEGRGREGKGMRDVKDQSK